MNIKAMCLACSLMASLFVCPAQAEVIGHWTLDETSGTVAMDSSGKGHHGTYVNSPRLSVPGALEAGTAMDTATGYMMADLGSDLPTGAAERTIALWLKPITNNIDRKFVAYGDTAAGGAFTFTIEPVNGVMGVRLRHWGGNYTYPGVLLNEWQHVTILVPPDSTHTSDVQVWFNGVDSPGTMTTAPDRDLITGRSLFYVGTVHNSPGAVFDGVVDDVWFFNHALTASEIAGVMAGGAPELAATPVPESGATDVPFDTMLSWTAGEFAATHDVYFGAAFDAVDAADRANPMDVLLSQGQTGAAFTPGRLEFGRTYYWRIDEVNGAPDYTTFKGDVWSFTTEPFAYPIANVTATASSAQVGMGPENTVGGIGLNADDRHATEPTTMWLSTDATPKWIQYEFDRVYKLHELWVWNSNQMTEAFVGFGARDVTVEYSVDGETWTALENVPEFARADGLPTYTANTVVQFGGAMAQYVRLTINAGWGGLPQTGLSEVRFFYVPVQAREPMPADDATDVALDAELNWRPGREASSHEVYLGTDQDTPALVAAPTEHTYTPGSLDFGTAYYWKVNEVGDTGTYEGDVWSFTTQEYATIEDFESYTDDVDAEATVWHAWIDGLTSKASGSQVGYDVSPFAERTIVHGGKQSMPFKYDNSASPFFSEAEREFATTQNWTLSGADTLSLWVRGVPAGFIENGGTITMSAAGHDIWDNADDFRFAYKTLTGDGSIVVKVESLVNTNNWAKAGVMIRQSLDADSKFVYMIQSFAQGVSMGNRPQTAATCTSTTVAGIAMPQWVKLIRKGDVFTAQYSADGTTWTDVKDATGAIASTTVAMANPVYIGLCVTSHNTTATTTAVMSGAAASGNVTGGPWEVLAIGDDPQPANDPGDLYVIVQDSANKTATATNPTAVTTGTFIQWQIPLSDLAGVNLTRVKKLILGVDSRNNSTKGAGMIYVDDIAFGHPAQTNP